MIQKQNYRLLCRSTQWHWADKFIYLQTEELKMTVKRTVFPSSTGWHTQRLCEKMKWKMKKTQITGLHLKENGNYSKLAELYLCLRATDSLYNLYLQPSKSCMWLEYTNQLFWAEVKISFSLNPVTWSYQLHLELYSESMRPHSSSSILYTYTAISFTQKIIH